MLFLNVALLATAQAACGPRVAATSGAGDFRSIQSAVDATPGAEPVLVCPGRHWERVRPNPDGFLVLAGATGDAADVTLATWGLHSTNLPDGTLADLSDLTITTAPRGQLPTLFTVQWEATLNLTDVVFRHARAYTLALVWGDTTWRGVRVEESALAGGLMANYARATIQDVAFVRNDMLTTSGLFLGGYETTWDVQGLQFTDNDGPSWLNAQGQGVIRDVIATSNTVRDPSLGGALEFGGDGPLTVTDLDVRGNQGSSDLLHLVLTGDARVDIEGAAFVNNDFGGSLIHDVLNRAGDQRATLTGVDWTGNSARENAIHFRTLATDHTDANSTLRLAGGTWRRNQVNGLLFEPGTEKPDTGLPRARRVRALRLELDDVDIIAPGVADFRIHSCAPLTTGRQSWIWDDRTGEFCVP
jgi:hypothetical protein